MHFVVMGCVSNFVTYHWRGLRRIEGDADPPDSHLLFEARRLSSGCGGMQRPIIFYKYNREVIIVSCCIEVLMAGDELHRAQNTTDLCDCWRHIHITF